MITVLIFYNIGSYRFKKNCVTNFFGKIFIYEF